MSNNVEIAGLVVIVTGGARGIGHATVTRLARAGAKVAIGDLDGALAATVAADIARETGAYVVGGALDVGDAESWTAFLSAVAEIGSVDVLVNNAGIMSLGSVLKESNAVTAAIVNVNLHGVINGTKAVAGGMADRRHGHIINVASAVGRVAVPNGATYSASKFAVVGFSEATRAELGPLGIDVSMVLPTVVLTELSAGVPAARGIKPVTADDVAKVIEATIRTPKAETWVPRWSQTVAKSAGLMPRRVKEGIAHLMKADAVLAEADESARAAYEARVRKG